MNVAMVEGGVPTVNVDVVLAVLHVMTMGMLLLAVAGPVAASVDDDAPARSEDADVLRVKLPRFG